MEVTNLDQVTGMFDDRSFRVAEAVRPAAQAAAQVFYDEVRSNVDRLRRHTARTKGSKAPGVLKDSIYQVFSKDNSGRMVSEYHVSWNHRKAPHGHLIEYGHMQPYQYYIDKQGNFHTAVKPKMLKKYMERYYGKTVPKHLRDKYFIRLPVPIQVPAYPFIRPAFLKAQEAYDKATKIILAAVNGAGSNIRMS
jgi:hypothetical protein